MIEQYDYGQNNPRNTRAINTEEKLLSYIKRQLGQPYIEVEVPDESIKDIIYEAVTKFAEYNWAGDLEKVLVFQSKGRGEYLFRDEVQEIFLISQADSGQMNFAQNYGQGFVPDAWIESYNNMGNIMSTMVSISQMNQMMSKYFGSEPSWVFSQGKNTLTLQDDFVGPVLVHYQIVYQPDEVDFIYNHPWVKEYQVQRTKFLWGTITGKFSQSLIGGQQINYSDMKSEAESDLQRLNEELLNKYTDPQPIDIF